MAGQKSLAKSCGTDALIILHEVICWTVLGGIFGCNRNMMLLYMILSLVAVWIKMQSRLVQLRNRIERTGHLQDLVLLVVLDGVIYSTYR